MNFKKLNYIFFALILILTASCSKDRSTIATLKATSTVKGVALIGLGTPVNNLATMTAADAGSVTITTAQAAVTSNAGNFVTFFDPTEIGATTKIVKYATGVDPSATFATDTAYNNEAITDQDFFIIRVTAQDGVTVLCYKIVVTVTPALSNRATVTSSAYTVSSGGTASETITNVRDAISKSIFLGALTKGESHQTWNSAGISDPVVTNDTLVVTAQDGTTVVTYTVTMNAAYNLRDSGPAGGWISYINPTYATDGWKYLEAAPVSTEWTLKKWSDPDTTLIGTNADIGKGQANTTAIVAWLNSQGETDRAAQLCDALVSGGSSDWFLPSKDEL
ncbi:MAG: hypothetical protein NTY22_09075, partial [Proteobacteria bacterium]|nr:hypothetical protein [Pseudomonadota bacterium]